MNIKMEKKNKEKYYNHFPISFVNKKAHGKKNLRFLNF